MKQRINRKGFTLIELIVVMAIISILALFGLPKYLNNTKDAHLTKIKVEMKVIEDAVSNYYMSYNDWPRLTDEPFTSEQLSTYAGRIRDKTGLEIELDSEGNYYEIDYAAIKNYATTPTEKENYILQNPVGNVYYLEDLTEVAKSKLNNYRPISPNEPIVPRRDEESGALMIRSAQELNKIGKDENYPLDEKYIQMADINLSIYSSGEGWEPIGNYSKGLENIFKGEFNGNGYKIKNLTINRSENFQGLFGRIEGGNIINVALENVEISGEDFTGAIAGYHNTGVLSKSYATGSVSGKNRTGGLYGQLGNLWSTSIEYCYYIGTVGGGNYTGGLAGWARGQLFDSYFQGDVVGKEIVGGLVGRGNNLQTERNYSIGTFKGDSLVGGLSGIITNSNVYYTYTTDRLNGKDDGSNIPSSHGNRPETSMKQRSTYQTWDFNNIWEIKEGQSYPTLQWQNN